MGKNLKVDRDILFYAFRYALGRSSFAPSSVMDNIRENIGQLSDDDLTAYIKEVDECEHFGMEMDRVSWMSFREGLAIELKKRQNSRNSQN